MKKRLSLALACLLVLALVFSVSAGKEAAMLAEAVSLPAALVKGHTYTLPQTIDGEQVNITVNGQPYTAPFQAEGESVVLAYTTADGDAIGSYTMPVIDTKGASDHCAYFYGDVSVQENQNDISLSCAKDAQTTFIKKLNSENFGINMLFGEGTVNYETLTVKLTDANDGSNSVTIRINPNALTIQANEKSIKVKELGNPMQLRYKNLNKAVYNGETQLFNCEKNDKGEDFTGFAGGVYLTLGFEGVTGNSTLAVNRLGNQSLGHKNSNDADLTEPVIVLTSGLKTTQFMGDTFDIPSFEAYDIYSDIAEQSVSVELPDGTTASESFTISQYGRYKIVYTAKDACGNSVKTNKMVFVNDDIAPTLQVNALEKTEYSVGDAIVFPGYTASDNLENCYVDVMAILPNCEVRLLTHDANGEITYALTDAGLYNATFRVNDSSFRAEQTGTYTLRYVAYDDQFNKTVHQLTFTVK